MTSAQLMIFSTDFVQLIIWGEDFLFKLFLLLWNQFLFTCCFQMHLFSLPGTTISETLKLVVYDRNLFRVYYSLFPSVILVSVTTENYMAETEQKQKLVAQQ